VTGAPSGTARRTRHETRPRRPALGSAPDRLTAPALRLLIGASVYREPAGRNALLFQIGEAGPAAAPEPAAGGPAPPYHAPADLAELISACADSGLLLVPRIPAGHVPPPGDMPPVFVDRQVAGTLHQDLAAAGRGDEVTGAHQRAAEYWQWQAAAWPQDRQADLHDLLEGRHHLHMAGDNDQAGALTEVVCAQLHAWGELDREAALIRETLAWLPPRSPLRAAWIQEIGKIAQVQGNYGEAEQRYRHSLEIFASIGDDDGVSRCHHRLGILAQARGDYAEAERRYQQSLDLLGQYAGSVAADPARPDAAEQPSPLAASVWPDVQQAPDVRPDAPQAPDARPDIPRAPGVSAETDVGPGVPQAADVRPDVPRAPDVPVDVPPAADVSQAADRPQAPDARRALDVLPMDPPASGAAPLNVLRNRWRSALRHDRAGRAARVDQHRWRSALRHDRAGRVDQPGQNGRFRLRGHSPRELLCRTGTALAAASALMVLSAAGLSGFLSHGGQATAVVPAAASATTTAVRRQAAAWITRQVSRSAIVSCDPAMCAALRTQAFPAGNLLTLQPSAEDPLGSDVVVATAAIRSQFGSRLARVYAPEVAAAFGAGNAGIQIRVIAPDGAAAYRSSLRADLLARQAAGAQLLRNQDIRVTAAVRKQLTAGQVDARLLTTLAALAAQHPLRILAFADSGPGASPGMPLRMAEISAPGGRAATARPGPGHARFVRSVLAFLRAQLPPYLAASTRTVRTGDGQDAVQVEFASPSPLNLLTADGASGSTSP
jgi:tetratricopeptide (TPR) repeat protein